MNNELKDRANPYVELSGKVGGLLAEQQATNKLLASQLDISEAQVAELIDIKDKLECFKKEHRSHRGWGKKVTAIALFLAVIGMGVEIATKGQFPLFTTSWGYLKGLLI